MKPSSIFKLTIFLVLSFFANVTFSQVTTGMAIQGIARDANNAAETNKNITLKFTVHYINGGTNYDVSEVSVGLTTDAFGVFSYVLDMSAIETSLFFDYRLKLKIEQTLPSTIAISDEYLNYVPYAVSALNGVPTGTIMPYVGATAPRGWHLCNGSALPNTAVTLKALVGDYAPDLRGMFLRGAGTNGNNSYSSNVGPNLKSVQTDGIKSHALTVTDPGHIHNITDNGHTHSNHYTDDDDSFGGSFDNAEGGGGGDKETTLAYTGISIQRDFTGIGVNYNGLGETRPVNYGVTYIIKL